MVRSSVPGMKIGIRRNGSLSSKQKQAPNKSLPDGGDPSGDPKELRIGSWVVRQVRGRRFKEGETSS